MYSHLLSDRRQEIQRSSLKIHSRWQVQLSLMGDWDVTQLVFYSALPFPTTRTHLPQFPHCLRHFLSKGSACCQVQLREDAGECPRFEGGEEGVHITDGNSKSFQIFLTNASNELVVLAIVLLKQRLQFLWTLCRQESCNLGDVETQLFK